MEIDGLIKFFGLAATITSTIAFLPQAIYVIRTKDTKSLSLAMYVIFVSSVVCWLMYGLLIKDAPIVVANIVCFAASSIILVYKIIDVVKERKELNANSRNL